MQKNL